MYIEMNRGLPEFILLERFSKDFVCNLVWLLRAFAVGHRYSIFIGKLIYELPSNIILIYRKMLVGGEKKICIHTKLCDG